MNLVKEVEKFISDVKDLRVCVIGETIIDEFVEVGYQGQSMKSFCPVFKVEANQHVRRQMGGAAAIASHLKDFVKTIKLISNSGEEIVKTRFIDKDDHKKHMELNKFDDKNFGEISVPDDEFDVVIVADFGHGYCDKLKISGKYHFMAQTNSNNFGYNRISKWKAYPKKSVCLDLREASLQMNNKMDFAEPDNLHQLFNYEMSTGHLFLTLGKKGSVFTDGVNFINQKSFKSNIVDTIGAGDTFFAFASLASEISGSDPENIMLVPSLAASLSCTWLCNEEEVNKNKLLAHAAQFL